MGLFGEQKLYVMCQPDFTRGASDYAVRLRLRSYSTVTHSCVVASVFAFDVPILTFLAQLIECC
jgi:hypothetical protein